MIPQSSSATTKDILNVAADRAVCNGGDTVGHPRVFLALPEAQVVICPYCGQGFQRDATVKGAH